MMSIERQGVVQLQAECQRLWIQVMQRKRVEMGSTGPDTGGERGEA